MSAGSLPSGLTRGYAKSFTDMLAGIAMKVLTIKELKDLDDAEMEAEDPTAPDPQPIESDHAVLH